MKPILPKLLSLRGCTLTIARAERTKVPDLFDELVNCRVCFAQENGVVFESPALVPVIDRAWIYPEKDEVLERILASPQDDTVDPSALAWEPSASMVGNPTYETYLPFISNPKFVRVSDIVGRPPIRSPHSDSPCAVPAD
jgi:hypothetical protein